MVFHDSGDKCAVADGTLIEGDVAVDRFATAVSEIVESDDAFAFVC